MRERLKAEAEKIELRDFPADVQDMLRDRAIERCVPISVVIVDYVMESSELIVATQEVA